MNDVWSLVRYAATGDIVGPGEVEPVNCLHSRRTGTENTEFHLRRFLQTVGA